METKAAAKKSAGSPIYEAPQSNEHVQAKRERDEGAPAIDASPDDGGGALRRHLQRQGANVMRRLGGLDVAGTNDRDGNAFRGEVFAQGFAIGNQPGLARAVSRGVRQALQGCERPNEHDPPVPSTPHSRQHRSNRYYCAFEIGAYQPEDLFD